MVRLIRYDNQTRAVQIGYVDSRRRWRPCAEVEMTRSLRTFRWCRPKLSWYTVGPVREDGARRFEALLHEAIVVLGCIPDHETYEGLAASFN